MAITLGPNGFESDSTDLSLAINNTTIVEDHRLAGGSTNPNQRIPVKKFKPSWGGYPNQGHATDTVWSNYSMAHNSTNSGFDSATGRFTAPIAGTYTINMGGITSGASSNIRYAIRFNGANNACHNICSSSGGNYAPTVANVSWYMNIGDYCECVVFSGASAHGGSWNNFSGYYVG
jgi:hypothetical protein